MHLFMSQEHENVHSYKNQTNAHMEVYKYINQKKKKKEQKLSLHLFSFPYPSWFLLVWIERLELDFLAWNAEWEIPSASWMNPTNKKKNTLNKITERVADTFSNKIQIIQESRYVNNDNKII